jgi:ABC-type antimicrobial peptide transport system permease subunit
MFWVDERRRQIGLRRPLGAKRSDILAHVLTENFLIILVLLTLGQCAALTPARRAAQMSPMEATRAAIGSPLEVK